MKITKCYFKLKSLIRNQRILTASLQLQKHFSILSTVGEQISTMSPRNLLLELLFHLGKKQSSSCLSTGLPPTLKKFRIRQRSSSKNSHMNKAKLIQWELRQYNGVISSCPWPLTPHWPRVTSHSQIQKQWSTQHYGEVALFCIFYISDCLNYSTSN